MSIHLQLYHNNIFHKHDSRHWRCTWFLALRATNNIINTASFPLSLSLNFSWYHTMAEAEDKEKAEKVAAARKKVSWSIYAVHG